MHELQNKEAAPTAKCALTSSRSSSWKPRTSSDLGLLSRLMLPPTAAPPRPRPCHQGTDPRPLASPRPRPSNPKEAAWKEKGSDWGWNTHSTVEIEMNTSQRPHATTLPAQTTVCTGLAAPCCAFLRCLSTTQHLSLYFFLLFYKEAVTNMWRHKTLFLNESREFTSWSQRQQVGQPDLSVPSFLISSLPCWLQEMHVAGGFKPCNILSLWHLPFCSLPQKKSSYATLLGHSDLKPNHTPFFF